MSWGAYMVKVWLVVMAFGFGVCSVPTWADELRLARIFGDGMVLQRDQVIPVWGWATPGAEVKVALGSVGGGRSAETKADADGKWMVRIESYPAGGPYQLAVNSESSVVGCSNVYMGDVWVCSGQSNMQWPIWVSTGTSTLSAGYPIREIANADYPLIRLYTVPMTTSIDPLDDVPKTDIPMYPGDSLERLGNWQACSPETVPSFSSVAYFFGRELHKNLDVPIGLIQTAWGGTLCEAWTSSDTLLSNPDFKDTVKQLHTDHRGPEELKQDYEAAWVKWRVSVDKADPGYDGGTVPWAQPGLDVSKWNDIRLPAIWEKSGYVDLDGYVWFRREIKLGDSWTGKDLSLRLTAINDQDQTWFNGVQISDFDDQPGVFKPRIYTVPAELVKEGVNTIAIRVYDMGNSGGFVKAVGAMHLYDPETEGEYPLDGEWKIRVGVELKDLPARPAPPLQLAGNPNVPTVLYNAMIEPLVPFGIKGAIWYQGESNANRAYQYRDLFSSMIKDWRTHWGQGDFPFLFVQLANFSERSSEPSGHPWAELREAQTMALSLPNTGMAVAIDIGDAEDIHPKNKQDVGKRLSLAARHVAYGEELVYSGPIYTGMEKKGERIVVSFDHIGSGLVSYGGEPVGFSVAGADQKFVWAHTKIVDNQVVVWNKEVPNPVAVRYAWAGNPVCNLYNAEGLPVSPFRTDEWPGLTVNNH